jgi:hypothetical protein
LDQISIKIKSIKIEAKGMAHKKKRITTQKKIQKFWSYLFFNLKFQGNEFSGLSRKHISILGRNNLNAMYLILIANESLT